MLRKNLLLFLLLVSVPASAASLFKNPGKWFRDTGRAIDQGRRNLEDGLADVITLGHLGRERDRARAAEARAVAAEKALGAERLKNAKVLQVKERLATAKANLNGSIQLLGYLNATNGFIVNVGRSYELALTELIKSNASFESILSLAFQQQDDLGNFIEEYLKLEPNSKELIAVKIKIDSYREQMEDTPIQALTEDDVEKIILKTMVNVREAINALGMGVKLVNANISRDEKTIAQAEADLKVLLAPPKPPAAPPVAKKKQPQQRIGVGLTPDGRIPNCKKCMVP